MNNPLEYTKELMEFDRKVREGKTAQLIKGLKKLGRKDAAKDIKEKGFPDYIIVTSDIYSIYHATLGTYGRVIDGGNIGTEHTMMLVWEKPKRKTKTYGRD